MAGVTILASPITEALLCGQMKSLPGVQKHQRIAYPGATKRFSDGYQWKHKQQVAQDLELLQQYYLRGYHTLNIQGKIVRMQVDSPYLHITPLKETLAGEK